MFWVTFALGRFKAAAGTAGAPPVPGRQHQQAIPRGRRNAPGTRLTPSRPDRRQYHTAGPAVIPAFQSSRVSKTTALPASEASDLIRICQQYRPRTMAWVPGKDQDVLARQINPAGSTADHRDHPYRFAGWTPPVLVTAPPSDRAALPLPWLLPFRTHPTDQASPGRILESSCRKACSCARNTSSLPDTNANTA